MVYIPSGKGNFSVDGHQRYNLGGGADVGFEVDFSSVWPNPIGLGFSLGIEAGITTNSLYSDNTKNLTNYSAGGVLGVSAFPVSRLYTRIDGAASIYVPTMDGFNGQAYLMWRAGGEVGFRFTPSFILSGSGGYRQYEDIRKDYVPVSSGYYAGLTAQIALEAGSTNKDRVEVELDQFDAVYPALIQLYQNNPVGNLIVKNRENAEIRDVRVSFRAAPYTSSEFYCGTIPFISRGREVEIPLLADFSAEVLRFTDSGRILGEVVIRYRFLGREKTVVSVISVACHNRNTVPIHDITTLAAFVSSTSPEVLDFSKYVVGLARSRRRVGHVQNMQYAVWLFEGLHSYGVRLGETYAFEDEVQFPSETMVFRTGSSRDLAMLYATALESVGIDSAIVKIGTDYIVAMNLQISPAAAETLFNDMNRVLTINNEVWLPVAMSAFNDGFIESWIRAVASLDYAIENDEFAEFFIINEAWDFYPPAPLPELGTRLPRTDSELVIAAADRTLNRYVSQDIMPILWRVEAQTRAAPSAAAYNRLGILQARAGRLADAKANYERAANMGSVPAMTNRGSIALNERDYAAAERWFSRALAADPENESALRGLERVEGRR